MKFVIARQPLLLFSILLPFFGSALSISVLDEWRFVHLLGHSVVEALGALAALAILVCLLDKQTAQHLRKHEITWISAALISMGLLDMFHAMERPGNNFVWFHSVATLAGGLLFACVWARSVSEKARRIVLPLVTLVTLALVAWSVMNPQYVPAMSDGKQFTPLARILNMLGGAGFIAAFAYFLKTYSITGSRNHYLLAAHCLLFGMAGILFELSNLWDAAWWWWHVLRFVAYLVLLVFFLPRIRDKFRHPMRSLRDRIMFLSCGIAVGVTLLAGGLNYVRSSAKIFDTAIEVLAGETRLLAVGLQRGYDEVRNDVRIVSRTPPVAGIIRSISNNEVDPIDGSTMDLWRTRLATIFTSVMRESLYYTQMRYIGLTDDGRELVRVNRTIDGLKIVPKNELQRKAEEPYVQAVIQGRKTFFFSKVTLNREGGAIDGELIPTIRAVMPIMDDDDKLFGMIVINVDFEAMQRQMFNAVTPNKQAFLINQSGDYVEYDPEHKTTRLEYHELRTKTPPSFLEKIQAAPLDEAVFLDADDITYYVRMRVDKNSSREFVASVVRIPRDELLRDVRENRNELLLLSISLIVISVFFAVLTARKITDPLARMTQSIRNVEKNAQDFDLPIERTDEIGELARAFHRLISHVAHNKTEREKLIASLEQSNKELDEFAYVASHDLKAPLRVIDNTSRWLEEDLAQHLDEDTKESMSLLRNRVQRMEKLLDDLLAYSRIGRKLDNSYGEILPGDVLAKDVLQLLSSSEKFEVHFSAEFTNVNLPRMPLQHVLLNLISNAIKHHDKGAGKIDVNIEDKGDYYAFSVSDDGPGIAPEFHNQVFKMFQTLKPRDQVEGSGMGLAMVKKHIEHFGGTITLESEIGKGCSFRFTWPKDQTRVNA